MRDAPALVPVAGGQAERDDKKMKPVQSPVNPIAAQKAASRVILLVSSNPSQKHSFAAELVEQSGLKVVTASSVEEALAVPQAHQVALAVVDDRIGSHSGLDLIKRLIRIDAFMYTAVFSDAGEEAFHERSEGLGVLAKLPLAPSLEDARRLWEVMKKMAG
jgi:CheY-like chemotaxis protein